MGSEVSLSRSVVSEILGRKQKNLPRWVKVSTVAAASAVAGGLAAAWFYRKTISTLRRAGDEAENSKFRICEAALEDDE